MSIYDTLADFAGKVSAWIFGWFGSDPRVESIREKVERTCQFLPTATSVAAMLTASNPTVTGVAGIATAICSAVTAARSRRVSSLIGSPLGTVNGVPIEGDDKRGR